MEIEATPLISLHDLTLGYEARGIPEPILLADHVNIDLSAGELVVVAGRSGSGKTTLLNVAAALHRPLRGSVSWLGEILDELASDEIAKRRARLIGYVFQNAGLIDSLTAEENVTLPGVPAGRINRERAAQLLDEFGLSNRLHHFPGQLSGGEQQRVAIARAMYNGPPILIVDEPTANADWRTASEIVGHLRRLADDGKGVLIATHDQVLIAVADRVIMLEAPINKP
jgi:ABC-type lipoprotein export system ATPase subunit